MRKIMIVLAIVLLAPCRAAYAQYPGLLPGQSMVSTPDTVLVGGGAPVQVLGSNAMRVQIWCVDVSNTNQSRVGDSNIGAIQGTAIWPGGAPLVLPMTGPLFAYSALGATINCGSIVRNGSNGP